jgi:hypothetical protein
LTFIIRFFEDYQQLPAEYDPLLAVAREKGLFHQREWFELLLMQLYQEAHRIQLYAVENSCGVPLALMPLRCTREDRAAIGANTVASIGHMENYSIASLLFNPVIDLDVREVLTELFSWMRSEPHGSASSVVEVLRVWPFEVFSTLGEDVREAMRSSGFMVQPYTNSLNRYEETAGLSYEDYFSQRSSNHRYNSRRRLRNLEKEGEVEFSLFTDDSDPERLQQAIDEYILVSVYSWKSPDSTVSAFIIELIKLAASQGSLRLGILRFNGRAIAAQFWTYTGGVASAIRPNYDESFKSYAPGVILSNYIIIYLLDTDNADSLDFGYGDDEYKEKWMKMSRHYCGFIGFNPSTMRGCYYGSKNILGQLLKRVFLKLKKFLVRNEAP